MGFFDGPVAFFDLKNRLAALSKSGDPLVRLKEVVDFEQFRSLLKAALKTRSGARSGGRPPTDARWRVKQSKPKKAGQVPLGIPEFGYKNPITACKTHGFVRGFLATHGAQHDGSVPMDLLADNTSGTVWGDSAYATQDNLARLKDRRMTSDLHRRKPQGKPMPTQMAKANSRRSKVRARIEHVFAAKKHRMTLFIRTIGLARATFKIGLANLVYNMQRLVWHTQKQQATG